MQKKNNKGVIALIIVLVLAAAALVIWQTNKPETQQGGKEITINVDHLNSDDTTFTIHTDEEYLRGALEQEDLIEGTESEYGLYVLTVDGETADESEQQWWGYSVNGTFAELGVDSLARLWFGDVTAVQLARSGLIHGSPDSVQKLSRLFATACGPVNLNDF